MLPNNLPVARLKSGVRVANFDIDRPLRFVGDVMLAGCDDERIRMMRPRTTYERCDPSENDNGVVWQEFLERRRLDSLILAELQDLDDNDDVDVVLVSKDLMVVLDRIGAVTRKVRRPMSDTPGDPNYEDHQPTYHDDMFCA
jgi:hypothetical protein